MRKKKELTKEELIKKEKRRLTGIFKEIEERRKKTVEGLIEEAAFMRITLTEIKDSINEHGTLDAMQQGDYVIIREHPDVKIYNTMVQRYTNVIDKLQGMLPKEIPKVEDDGFDDFLNSK